MASQSVFFKGMALCRSTLRQWMAHTQEYMAAYVDLDVFLKEDRKLKGREVGMNLED